MSAKEFAIKLHENDKWGQAPYYVHLEAVANKVRNIGTNGTDDFDTLSDLSWLHDSLEDHPECTEQIFNTFNQYKDTLSLLTRKNGETYSDYIQRIADSENREAIIVKIADLSVNNETAPSSLKERYGKALKLLVPLV